MQVESFDAIIIGAGQAGPALAARCAREGLRTAVIERGHFGGTCVNVGCVPTKTMVASARAIHMARRGSEFGFSAGDVEVKMARIKARKDEIVLKSRSGVQQWMQGLKNAEVIQGDAKFIGSQTVRIGARTLTAPRIFINVGGRSVVPDLAGLSDVPYLDNASIMELTEVPDHLVVVGGSYIGLEFAQMMRRFGAQVTVVERSAKLLSREDEDVSDGIRAILEAEGVAFQMGAECLSLSRDAGRVVVGAVCGAESSAVVASHVLLAVGRRPNTDGLGLEAAGIKLDERGYIVVDEQLRTSSKGVWAVGDCNGRGAFTHTAWNDHEIVAANLFDRDPRRVSDRIPCYALFIDPALGRVGMTEREVRATGRPALLAKMPMQRVSRAREAGETLGFMKVLVDADTNRLLGAAILGMNGDEVVHGLLDIMAADQPYTAISRAMHIHPTVSELVPTLLQQLKPLASA
ncbi:MAG: mercuric reductase [Polaromonas sp. 39-63-203]|uniref:FAD-containing oxidoreductase n=1 Tax=Polaromonas sp. TaxID=1869339 RepID=UPI000BCDF0D6|nr:FAD-containing oxidoreductase [Polaromonas sp.]OYY53657.1 MAG: mercuric reductase [Polaromonas sp. 35-63-240]OYZ03331.1 MAG: mercuric reductase [Polaromonas sp. 28-63-22]OYZ85152.1 MAG: mercuric reductase [Polaromonas sp. 24-62-144]OZB02465.1 MAG: mercuric reductase [Polaromonas sp. 39-63-203]HQS30614.1 FAD-containing oxidoreductase [Polaromonas sp.]